MSQRHYDYECPITFFDTKEYKSFLLAITGAVRMAERTKQDATFRFIKSIIGDSAYLIDGVKELVNAGVLIEAGSAIRRVFYTTTTPKRSAPPKRTEHYGLRPSAKSTLPDLGV